MQRKTGGRVDAPYHKLPKHFRKFLDKNGDERVEALDLWRVPLDKLTTTTLQIITAGTWEDIKKRAGMDKLFHTFAVINGKYLYEKTAIPVLTNLPDGKIFSSNDGGVHTVKAPVKNISIRDMIGNAINKMGDLYFSYNAFENNCQDFLEATLEANGMNTETTHNFLKQDIKRLIQETPGFSKYIATKLTNIATAAQNAYEEVTEKRGGKRLQGGFAPNMSFGVKRGKHFLR